MRTLLRRIDGEVLLTTIVLLAGLGAVVWAVLA